MWINPWTTRGFPPQKPPNRRAQPPLFHRPPPIPPWISRFSTIPFPWKSLFVHSAPPSPPPSVSHKAHRFQHPAMAVENRKFCIIAPFSPDSRRIAAPAGRPVWITPPNSPVCSRFSKAHRTWERRNFLPPPPWICVFSMIYRAVFPVNTGQPVDKFHFSTVSPPLLRLRLRISLFSLYIRRFTAARLRFETKRAAVFPGVGERLRRANRRVGDAFPEMQESGGGLHFVHKVFAYLLRHRDLSRLPYTYDLQSAISRAAGTEYRSARLRLNLRYGLFDLQSADVLCSFIRNLRLA